MNRFLLFGKEMKKMDFCSTANWLCILQCVVDGTDEVSILPNLSTGVYFTPEKVSKYFCKRMTFLRHQKIRNISPTPRDSYSLGEPLTCLPVHTVKNEIIHAVNYPPIHESIFYISPPWKLTGSWMTSKYVFGCSSNFEFCNLCLCRFRIWPAVFWWSIFRLLWWRTSELY